MDFTVILYSDVNNRSDHELNYRAKAYVYACEGKL